MGYNAMAEVSSVPPMLSGKMKRTTRSARMKQRKLDAPRDKWLPQAMEVKDDRNVTRLPSSVPSLQAREDEEEGMPSAFRNPSNGTHHRRNDILRLSSSSRSSIDSTSRSISDEEDVGKGEENGVLDNWEAIADALSGDIGSDEKKRSHHFDPANKKSKQIRSVPRAWKPDDASRPQTLPSISKQWMLPNVGHREQWVCQQKGILPLPISCPICYEDLDRTDSSFLPCSCGFRLCLFCHKKILEADGRCPGCRKQYNSFGGGLVEVKMGGAPGLKFQVSQFM
ncbi:hypothetical protein Cni_G17607 [Canna indica]|uniref:RING-type domain-containing protein n=1 Tax=Canna indica TaxID=4628 RepID=A0AAQ3KHZ5_9LILI|nr:hypothetical protein Cni_G17607 [Canna indica]